ncbi:MAG: hypothetical protein ACRD15_08755, partial [Vicinamibacterales bacterium]
MKIATHGRVAIVNFDQTLSRSEKTRKRSQDVSRKINRRGRPIRLASPDGFRFQTRRGSDSIQARYQGD